MTVQQIIDVIAPQYSTDASLANTVILATQRTSEDAFGDNYSYAIALRTAHILTLRDMRKDGVNSGLGGTAGMITNKSEGNTSIGFGSMTGFIKNNSNDLALTSYGIELLGLINGNIVGFSVANYSNVEINLNSEEGE
jgi:hypothetical protein